MVDKSLIKIKSAKPSKTASPHLVYKIKVQLRNAPYPIWRVLLVDGDDTIADLLIILLHAMGWDGSHLYDLRFGNESFVNPSAWGADSNEGLDGDEYLIRNTLPLKSKSLFTYDYGDSWEHTVTVEDILIDDTSETPFCIKGKGACPPEDCGGVYGFYNLLQTIEDPDDPDYENMRDWLGDDFDPNNFDINAVNSYL